MHHTKLWTRRAQLLVMGLALLGGPGQASQSDTVSSLISRFSGTGLTFTDCRQRMSELGTLLEAAGYHSRGTHSLDDGTLVAWWYHTASRTTALAYSDQWEAGNNFLVIAHSGDRTWKEPLLVPR